MRSKLRSLAWYAILPVLAVCALFLVVVLDRALFWRLERDVLARASRSRPVLAGGKSMQVLFLGDSIIAAFPLKAFLPQNLLVINAGVSRQTTTEILERYKARQGPWTSQVVLIEGGLNDLMQCVGHEQDPAMVLDRVVRNFETALDLAEERNQRAIVLGVNPITEPFLLSTFRLVRLPEEFDVQKFNTLARELSVRLSALCRRRGVEFLDPAEILSAPDGGADRLYAARDGYHLNIRGYERLGLLLSERLEKIARAPAEVTGVE